MMRTLALIVSLAVAGRAQERDPAAELAPHVKTFVEVFAILEQHGAEKPVWAGPVYQGALPAALRSLDPHSIFFDPDNFQQLQEMERSVARGFGTIVSVYPGRVVILQAQPGGPAARAGLSPGDEILAINGYVLARLDTEQLIQLLSQARQQRVRMDVRRASMPRLMQFDLLPEAINQPSVDRMFRLESGVGYVRVASFEKSTGADTRAAIEKIGGAQLPGLVLDLRGNPGGVLTSALEIASLFLKPGQRILSVKGRNKQTEDIDVPQGLPAPYAFPVAVLVDAKSASAAEIVAVALQDHGRAKVVGVRTFGKGLVQNVFPLKESTAVALTIAFYYSPQGRSIQRPLKDVQLAQAAGQQQGGVEPDAVVRPPAPSRLRVALDASGSFTTFATEVVRSRVLGPDFQVDGALLDEFRAWLAKRNIQPGVPEWTADVAWSRDRLKQEIVNLTAGVEKGDEIEMARDPFVLRALETLRVN